MPIYRIENDTFTNIQQTTFAELGIKERRDLQSLLKKRIDVVSPETMVVAEEFGEWEDSRLRIDLLGIDKDANLVVIELKRNEDGGHMELQAIRYAAMISTLSFDQLVNIYSKYISHNGEDGDARERLLQFLDWETPGEKPFGQEVKIVLASADFSKELTTSVMWLNGFELDIRCVRIHPYTIDEQIYVDVQTVIPLPEVADYQVRYREKIQNERESRRSAKDKSKYNVTVDGKHHTGQNNRRMIFSLISGVLKSGRSPQEVTEAVGGRKIFEDFDGTHSADFQPDQ